MRRESLPILPIETPEFAADPNPFVEEAKRQHPWLARFSQGYVVYGYQALCDLFFDDKNLVQGLGAIIDFYGVRGTMWARFMEEIVISRSGPMHGRLRTSAARAFTPKRANIEREMMRQVINNLLNEWAPKGAFDFAEFASYFPVSVICGLLGVSADRIPKIRTAVEDHMSSLSMDPGAKPLFLAAWEVLWEFADTLVREREASGKQGEDSLLDALIESKNNGQLDEVELRFMVLTIIIAGYDTSKNQLTMTMKLLLERPAIYARCADDRDYCGKVVDESLRHSSIATPFREAAHDFDYQDFQFHKADALIMATALGNRDPTMFAEPDKFDPDRDKVTRHVAFGRGPHICLGMYIAKNQLQEGLHMIAQRVRSPRLDGEISWRPFMGAWGPRTLPISFSSH
jgi:cytochrome P450